MIALLSENRRRPDLPDVAVVGCRPVRILEESVGELPTLTAQDPSDLQGALVYDNIIVWPLFASMHELVQTL